MITLEIYSDPVCPWCYIGKVALERAMEARPDHPFAVTWHPFMLNPDMPAEGMDRQDYLELKFGADLVTAYGPVVKRARELGAGPEPAGDQRASPTRWPPMRLFIGPGWRASKTPPSATCSAPISRLGKILAPVTCCWTSRRA